MDKHTLEWGIFPTPPSLCQCCVSTRNKEILMAFFFFFGQLEKNQLLLSSQVPTLPGTFLESLWLESQLRVNDSAS